MDTLQTAGPGHRRRSSRLRAVAAAVALLLVTVSAACGKDSGGDAASFQGKDIRFVVSYGTGGGYDLIARAIAPYLEKQLGATVVVENQDGAGGLVAANRVYAAKPDGLTFGFFSGQGMAGATLGKADGAKFEVDKFSYIARLTADPRILSVNAKGKYATIDDVRTAGGFRFGSSGPGGSEHIDATVLFPILGIDGKIVTGYKGSAETELAVTSADVDGTSGTLSTRLPPIQRGEHRGVLAIGEKRLAELPKVPALLELDLDEQNMTLAKAHTAVQAMGRMVWAPPGMPEDKLAALEKAFAAAAKDPQFVADMKKTGQPMDYLAGPEAKKVADSVLNAPPGYKALLEKAYQGQ